MRGLRVIALLALSALAACEQETEGCLDFRALRVDVGADNACDDCCEYPRLSVQFVPLDIGPDTALRVSRGRDIVLGTGDTARLLDLAFYVSDVALLLDGGGEVLLTDTLSFRQNATATFERVEESAVRINALAANSARIGTLLEARELTGLRLRLGLPPELAGIRADAQRAGSLVAPTRDSLLVSADRASLLGGYGQLARPRADTLAPVRASAEASEPFAFPFGSVVPVDRSFNVRVSIGIDVRGLAGLPAGTTVSGQVFAEALLRDARLLEVTVSR